jgi:hypothetical protein
MIDVHFIISQGKINHMTANRPNNLTAPQMNEFLICNFFTHAPLPHEVAKIITAQQIRAAQLLEHVAFGREDEAKAMLDDDPTLLSRKYSSTVMTPSGLTVIDVTPFECALGGGDPEMVKMITPYFDKFSDGETERAEQYEKYRPHIENIMKQKRSYDLTKLFETLINSTDQDVQAELNHTSNYKSALRTELEAFRKHFTPGEVNTPCMHFNYLDLFHAYNIFERNWRKLVPANNYDKCSLFCRQVIGFEQRNLPARDRQIYASGLYGASNCNRYNAARSFDLCDKGQVFPITAGLDSHTGLGFNFYIDIQAGRDNLLCTRGEGGIWAVKCKFFMRLMSSKSNKLADLCSHIQLKKCGV